MEYSLYTGLTITPITKHNFPGQSQGEVAIAANSRYQKTAPIAEQPPKQTRSPATGETVSAALFPGCLAAWLPDKVKHKWHFTGVDRPHGVLGQHFKWYTQQSTQWVLLGTYPFSGDGSEYIELSDSGGKTSADAVKLVETQGQPGSTTANIYFIHSDHLGTPQVITDSSQQVVWSSDREWTLLIGQ